MLHTFGRMIIFIAGIVLGIILTVESMFLGSFYIRETFDLFPCVVNCLTIIFMFFAGAIALYTVFKNNSGRFLIIYGCIIIAFSGFNFYFYGANMPGDSTWLLFAILDLTTGIFYLFGSILARKRVK
ncbi:MAG: hypothetical protein RSD40_06045 [Bacilli bacterium]